MKKPTIEEIMHYMNVEKLRKEGDAIPETMICQRSLLSKEKYLAWR
jgi:hypothetical protein